MSHDTDNTHHTDINQKLFYSVEKDEKYDLCPSVNTNNVIKKHQKRFDQKKRFQNRVKVNPFSVVESLNFCDSECDQINYYKNFSKNADEVFYVKKLSVDILRRKKKATCLLPTFLPPSPSALWGSLVRRGQGQGGGSNNSNNNNKNNNKQNNNDDINNDINEKITNLKKSDEISDVKEVEKEVQDAAGIERRETESNNKAKRVPSVSYRFLTPEEAEKAGERDRERPSAHSVSSAGTESQIKTPSQTQVVVSKSCLLVLQLADK